MDRSRIELVNVPFRVFAVLFAVLLLLVCVPLFLTPLPPLVDYPNHLARMHVLADWGRSPLLRQYYTLAWHPVPDLAMDLLVPPLLGMVSLQTAGKLFLAATYFLATGGVAVLYRVVHRHWSVWPLTAFLLVYNRLLLWGLVNDLFGLGLALWALAGWIAWRERGVALRLGVGLVAALAVYFAHLMAFGIYGAMILGYEVGRVRHDRLSLRQSASTLLVALLPFLPCLVLFAAVFVPLHAAGALAAIHLTPLRRKPDLLFSVFDLYNRPFDVACFVAAVIGTAFAYWRRWLRLAPEVAAPLILLAVLYLVMPDTLFGATGADRRLPLALAMLLIGGSTWHVAFQRQGRIFLAAALVMFVVRLAVVAASWQITGQGYAKLLAGLDMLPRGARVAVAFPGAEVNAQTMPLLHFPVLAVARRDAFVPTLFAYATQQPIAFSGDYRPLVRQLSADGLWRFYVQGARPMAPVLARALAHCGYITFAARRPFTVRPNSDLVPVFVTPRFQIYRLVGLPS